MLAIRCLGLGYHKRDVSRRQWSRDFLNWLDQYTHYRSRVEIRTTISRQFESIEFHEDDYMRFRVEASRLSPLTSLLKLPGFLGAARWVSIRFGSTVLVARKSATVASETSAAA
jgi:hypothetical protein